MGLFMSLALGTREESKAQVQRWYCTAKRPTKPKHSPWCEYQAFTDKAEALTSTAPLAEKKKLVEAYLDHLQPYSASVRQTEFISALAAFCTENGEAGISNMLCKQMRPRVLPISKYKQPDLTVDELVSEIFD